MVRNMYKDNFHPDQEKMISDTFIGDRKLYESVEVPEKLKGVLKIIRGPIAEWDLLNRNKRKYSERLWDITLESDYVKEQLFYRTLFGELNHPTDRYEVDFTRVSHVIVRMWKVPASNQIYGEIWILDTPSGRILNTLYDAGSIIGYSSRAGGTLTPRKGYTEVDENNYNFVTFDAVPFPSVKSARPSEIVEGKEPEKTELSEETHNKLFAIIKESSTKERQQLKSVIYNLENYDVEREKQLLESIDNFNIDPKEDDSVEKTTLSLLKESSKKYESLKAESEIMRIDNAALLKENASLKESLSEALSRLSSEVSEKNNLKVDYERKSSVSESYLDDTIRKLNSKIDDLTSEIADKDSEIDYLTGIAEASKVMKVACKNESENELSSIKEELSEAYGEVSALIQENNKLSHDLDIAAQTIADMCGENKSLEDMIDTLREENKKINESVSIEGHSSMQKQVDRLEGKVKSLNEELRHSEDLLDESKHQRDVYKNGMVEVICSSYGLDSKRVMNGLKSGFSKSDVYTVCESLSKSYDSIGLEIKDEQPTKKVFEGKDGDIPNQSMIMNGLLSNRRGIGII